MQKKTNSINQSKIQAFLPRIPNQRITTKLPENTLSLRPELLQAQNRNLQNISH